MKLLIELNIEISEGEEPAAVLSGYFTHQSHVKGRKVLGFEIVKDHLSEVSNNSDEELMGQYTDVSEDSSKIDIVDLVLEEKKPSVSRRTKNRGQ